jgi:ribosome-associated heat shock protein Hsp15
LKNGVRIDKWLHAVRLFKTRTIATEACDGSKVSVNNTTVKPARHILEGDIITMKKGGITFTYKVLKLIEKRVGAPQAVLCYEDLTPAEEKNKVVLPPAFYLYGERDKGDGRPTKKDRRDIDDLQKAKEEWWDSWEEE